MTSNGAKAEGSEGKREMCYDRRKRETWTGRNITKPKREFNCDKNRQHLPSIRRMQH